MGDMDTGWLLFGAPLCAPGMDNDLGLNFLYLQDLRPGGNKEYV